MSDASQFTAVQAEAVQNQVEFLRSELATSFTFIAIAETELKIGSHERAERSLADAEQAYATIQRFLANPKHSEHLSDEERREFT